MRRHPQPGRVVRTGPEGHVGPARYHDTVTGADLVTSGRDTLTYAREGRELLVPVEYGVRGTVIVYGLPDGWTDGTPLTVAQRRDVQEMLTQVAQQERWTLDVVYDLVTGEKR